MRKDEIDVSELTGEPPAVTELLSRYEREGWRIRRIQLVAVEGATPGRVWESSADRCSIGSDPSNDVVLDDPAVSRFHCEVRVDDRGVRVRDLGSKNGVNVDGTDVVEAWLRPGSLLRLGRAALRLQLTQESNWVPASDRTEFGALAGSSIAMRTTFTLLAKVAASDATVLIEGETGTGKDLAAESIHRESARRDKPFLVIDCGAIPAALLESELFGHERGSFTGAAARRVGVFEEAAGGTVFLDEIGELSADLQPKLLRVLERREVRRVGANTPVAIDVRVIAATNRDLRAEVNAGRFRADLYYRLAVVKVHIPPLRARPEDIPILAERILTSLAGEEAARRLATPELLAGLKRSAWPGNVRELRNHLERCLIFEEAFLPGEAGAAPGPAPADPDLPYATARRHALDDFERRYLEALLARHKGKVAQAARAAGMDRVYLYKLLQRHRIKR